MSEFSQKTMVKMFAIKKNFFLAAFLISAGIFILSAIIVMIGVESFASLAMQVWGLNVEFYLPIAILLMGLWKILIIQFTLIPFLALWVIEKQVKTHLSE
jgi:hypothetical protein